MNFNITEKMFTFFHRLIEKNFHLKKISKIIKNSSNSNNPIIFDVGSNVGESIELFLDLYENPTIYSFEPQKESFEILIDKYDKNEKIKLFKLAFGSKKEELNLKINIKSSTSTFSKINTNSKYFKLKSLILSNKKKNIFLNEEKAQVEKIDNFLVNQKIQYIDILKIDTEGFELEVIKGAEEALKKTKVIIIEFHLNDMYLDYNPKKIEDLLHSNNFTLMKSLKFPFMQYEDRIYINKKF